MVIPSVSVPTLCVMIFISLGVEILLANAQKGVQIVYDKAGIFLVFVLTFFAFFMAAAQRAVELEWYWW